MINNDLLKNEFRKRIDCDFVNRSKLGVIFYAVAWSILFLASSVHLTNPYFCWIMAGLLALISAIRLGLMIIITQHYERFTLGLRRLQTCLVIAHACLWSILFFLANALPAFSELTTSINILTAGIASASVISLTPKYRICLIYNAVLTVPTGVFLLLDPEQWNLGVLIGFFCFYLIYITRRYHKEYMRAFRIEWSLQAKQKELQALSQTDFLTKTYNRLFFNEQIAHQWYLAQRNREELALLMIDLDHFKLINDKYGHVFGDECLVHTAKIIRNVAKRRSDMVVRYGGEEFAVILPQTGIASAISMAENIREALSAQAFSYRDAQHVMTTSIGVCAMLPIGNDYKVLLHQADDALYKAKKNGRNRVEVSELNQYEDVP
ncbi:GGDEF domain-containing protein [Alteromonas sp. a30]|uniref:GGDEF domain-containing protein n=1 Tax=Alteromonas sp. a30 TaxID=2730917 RepID=UPI0022811017|nr:GGDEF domain-containing protein [Alteromonas sp. a30]MCY7294663.1 GGDEF domain-containing protein [Alteromonas sp. a30]